MALDRLKHDVPEFDYDLVGWSEIDKYAIIAHNAVYPEYAGRNYGDITRIDWKNVPDFDLFTYSFPCTDISRAGPQAGFEEDSDTRSSLLWECRKAILAKRPKYLLCENVKGILENKFLPLFKKWEQELAGYGYNNVWQVLDAKDYGVPQSRERVFLVSTFGDEFYYFPEKMELTKSLNDILEPSVDKKYYLSERTIRSIINLSDKARRKGNGFRFLPTDGCGIASTITSKSGNQIDDNFIMTRKNKLYCLNPGVSIIHRIYHSGGSSPTICCSMIPVILENYNIRRLTERECFRLMGVSEEDITLIQKTGISMVRQFKLAGNSIVVDVLYYIFLKLFSECRLKTTLF